MPLAITAVTQKALDQQGVTQIADLTRLVPSLQIVTTGAGGSVGQFAIRGISSTAGAAVTGVYLDDVPLTKRNQNGGWSNLNGSPAPPLFDLERVGSAARAPGHSVRRLVRRRHHPLHHAHAQPDHHVGLRPRPVLAHRLRRVGL